MIYLYHNYRGNNIIDNWLKFCTFAKIEALQRFMTEILSKPTVRRKNEIPSNPPADSVFSAGDILFVVGEPDRIADVICLFNHSEPTKA